MKPHYILVTYYRSYGLNLTNLSHFFFRIYIFIKKNLCMIGSSFFFGFQVSKSLRKKNANSIFKINKYFCKNLSIVRYNIDFWKREKKRKKKKDRVSFHDLPTHTLFALYDFDLHKGFFMKKNDPNSPILNFFSFLFSNRQILMRRSYRR